jgi:small nuclear ribonucleoprotein (snRNP)-like protein
MQVETKNGELYRGELYEAEDNWNCQLRAVQMTGRVRNRTCHGTIAVCNSARTVTNLQLHRHAIAYLYSAMA